MSNPNPGGGASPSTTGESAAAASRVVVGYLAAILVSKLVSADLIPADQADTFRGLLITWAIEGLPYAIMIAHAIFAWMRERKSSLISRVQRLSDTEVVTADPAVKAVVPDVVLAPAGTSPKDIVTPPK